MARGEHNGTPFAQVFYHSPYKTGHSSGNVGRTDAFA
jgi:hypothetical protein